MTGSTSIPSSKTDRKENRPASAAQLESVPVQKFVDCRLGPYPVRVNGAKTVVRSGRIGQESCFPQLQ